jgi:hypothetical protein
MTIIMIFRIIFPNVLVQSFMPDALAFARPNSLIRYLGNNTNEHLNVMSILTTSILLSDLSATSAERALNSIRALGRSLESFLVSFCFPLSRPKSGSPKSHNSESHIWKLRAENLWARTHLHQLRTASLS